MDHTGDLPGETTDDPLLAAAHEQFGISYLFPFQRLVVSNVLEGRNQIVVLPTGAGKSFCFLLPAALLEGLTIIVYPLRSLIADQARRLSHGSIQAEPLTGETPRAERPALFARCRDGETRILLTNPEMLIQERVQRALAECAIAHLVVDEAHVLPEWGKSFRPAYLEFARIAPTLGARIRSAFTATASPAILAGLEETLFPEGPPHRVLGIPDRPNIHYSVRFAGSIRHELHRIACTEPRPMLIFCRSRAGAELTAAMLREETGDRRIRFYHAGLTPEEKHDLEAWFFDADDAILASTCAYGMGVDKSNIRTVVHADTPESVEAYLQETGRAGRDGAPSVAIAVAGIDMLRRISRSDSRDRIGPEKRLADSRNETMRRYLINHRRCRRRYLLDQLGAERVECSGCDVCDGNVSRAATDLEATARFFSRHRHRYARAEAVAPFRRHLSRIDSFVWSIEETEDLLTTAERYRVIGPPPTRIGKLVYGTSLVLRRR